MRSTWLIPLEGLAQDLDSLVHWTKGSPIHVAKLEEQHQLVMPYDAVGDNSEKAHQAATDNLAVLNGIGGLFDVTYQPVRLTNNTSRFDETGIRRNTVFNDLVCSYRILGAPLEEGDDTCGAAGPLLREASKSNNVFDALVLAGRQLPTWAELYVAFELVATDEKDVIHVKGWATKADVRRFKHTANSRSALGRLARHGTDKDTDPPGEPMTHKEAVAFVRSLVNQWIRTRATCQEKP